MPLVPHLPWTIRFILFWVVLTQWTFNTPEQIFRTSRSGSPAAPVDSLTASQIAELLEPEMEFFYQAARLIGSSGLGFQRFNWYHNGFTG